MQYGLILILAKVTVLAKEKKDLQVAGLRDLLQVANNGAFSFKGTAPQGYTITTANCGDNAGMVKWTSDNVVTPLTRAGDLSDVYLYGNIANCEFYLDDEEVAKPAYSKIYIRFLGIQLLHHQNRAISWLCWCSQHQYCARCFRSRRCASLHRNFTAQ